MDNSFSQFEKSIGHKFANINLLVEALCHKSYINECKKSANSYERLEFLGDSILGVIVSAYIFDNYPHLPEGELTKLRAAVVCEATLANAARNLDAGRYVLLSKGEAMTGGSDKDALLCDVFEAVVAAIYLDSDMDSAKRFVLENLADVIDSRGGDADVGNNFKSSLQEYVQQKGGTVEYRLHSEEGPEHCREYTFGVYINGECIAEGAGTSKKKAQQSAARCAVEKYCK